MFTGALKLATVGISGTGKHVRLMKEVENSLSVDRRIRPPTKRQKPDSHETNYVIASHGSEK